MTLSGGSGLQAGVDVGNWKAALILGLCFLSGTIVATVVPYFIPKDGPEPGDESQKSTPPPAVPQENGLPEQSPNLAATLAPYRSHLLTPEEGRVRYRDVVEGDAWFPSGHFGVVTIHSHASNMDYLVAILDRPGKFKFDAIFGLPHEGGSFDIRLWVTDLAGRLALDEYENQRLRTCKEGLASLQAPTYIRVDSVTVQRAGTEDVPRVSCIPQR